MIEYLIISGIRGTVYCQAYGMRIIIVNSVISHGAYTHISLIHSHRITCRNLSCSSVIGSLIADYALIFVDTGVFACGKSVCGGCGGSVCGDDISTVGYKVPLIAGNLGL